MVEEENYFHSVLFILNPLRDHRIRLYLAPKMTDTLTNSEGTKQKLIFV